MAIRVLFLCTGNSARSLIAEALLRHIDSARFEAFSAGTDPKGVNPLTVRILAEVGIDISHARSKSVSELLGQEFDYVITVCDQARETCPVFRRPRVDHQALTTPPAEDEVGGPSSAGPREICSAKVSGGRLRQHGRAAGAPASRPDGGLARARRDRAAFLRHAQADRESWDPGRQRPLTEAVVRRSARRLLSAAVGADAGLRRSCAASVGDHRGLLGVTVRTSAPRRA
jgi:arsenate reductase